MSHFDSQTTVLKRPQMTVAHGAEWTFSCGVVQLEKHMEGSLCEALRTPTATGLPIKYEGLAPSEQGVATPTAGKEDAISSAVCSPVPLTSPMLTVAVPFLSRGWTHSLAPLMVTKNHCLAPFPLNFSKSVPLPNILHHFTRPFLKLFLLNFYDSSHFYSA